MAASKAHICYGPPMKVIRDEVDGDGRWCFRCRKRTEFRYIVRAPAEISYYGPNPSIECVDGHVDGDMFPGDFREWIEES